MLTGSSSSPAGSSTADATSSPALRPANTMIIEETDGEEGEAGTDGVANITISLARALIAK